VGHETRPCPACGQLPVYGRVLAGWRPCNCGGHRTTRCRADKGGCGHLRLDPPHDPEVCLPDPGHAPHAP